MGPGWKPKLKHDGSYYILPRGNRSLSSLEKHWYFCLGCEYNKDPQCISHAYDFRNNARVYNVHKFLWSFLLFVCSIVCCLMSAINSFCHVGISTQHNIVLSWHYLNVLLYIVTSLHASKQPRLLCMDG